MIRWLLGVIVLADVVLLAISWRMATAPGAPQAQLKSLELEHKLLAADVARAELIRKNLPAVEKQSDDFFHDQFRPARTGYSAVADDLGALARTAGIRTEGLSFHQRAMEKRGVTEVDIGTTVDGDYLSIVRFINGLQRSETFYILDSLSLAAGSTGQVKLNLQLRTFFRT